MNKISVSTIYDKFYNIKSFIVFDNSTVQDYLIESSDNSFLLDLINKYENIVVFDIKQFLKLYSYRKIQLSKEQIDKIDSIKLLYHLQNVDKHKNIEFTDIVNVVELNNYNARINGFKKIYKDDRWLTFIPTNMLFDYNVLIAKSLYNIDIKIDNVEYYKDLKWNLYQLGKCEQNGIKIKDDSIDNINRYVYPEYLYDSTSTGRLYNRYPVSFQILAKDSDIRTKFISRFENGKFLIADWNSIDLRVAFAMAGEHINTEDLHSDVAKMILEKEEITEEDRRTIKEINFSIIYGAGLDSVSKKTGIEKDRLIDLIQKLFVKFPKLKEFILKTRSDVLEKGYAESYFGRKRYLSKDDTTKFINSTIQCTSADICLRAIDHTNDLFDYVNIETKMIPYIVYDKLAFDVENKETEINYTKNLVTNVMSINAPGDLTKFVNFPIKIEIRETL